MNDYYSNHTNELSPPNNTPFSHSRLFFLRFIIIHFFLNRRKQINVLLFKWAQNSYGPAEDVIQLGFGQFSKLLSKTG